MRRFNNPFLIFQILFFGVSIFLLHFAMFEFWNFERDLFWRVFENWFPLLILDFIGGLLIGFLICGAAIIFVSDKEHLIKPLILTDILWVILSICWYSVFRDTNGREPAIHVISPILLGGIGIFFALIILVYFAIISRKAKQIS